MRRADDQKQDPRTEHPSAGAQRRHRRGDPLLTSAAPSDGATGRASRAPIIDRLGDLLLDYEPSLIEYRDVIG